MSPPMKAMEEALRRSERDLAAELSTALGLQHISTQLIPDDRADALYGMILDTATALLHADFATIQVFCPDRGTAGELRLLGHRGFTPEAVEFWQWVSPASQCPCGIALGTRSRVLIPDVRRSDSVATRHVDALLQIGILGAQTTPLLSRSGELLGMLSTHWREPHEFTASELRTLDVLARQAADLLERSRAEEKIRRQAAILAGINRILHGALGTGTDEELGSLCLAVAEEVTASPLSLIGEIGADGCLNGVVVSVAGRRLAAMPSVDLAAHPLCRRVLEDGRGFLTNDPAAHSSPGERPAGHPPLSSFLGVPLARDGRAHGLIAVANREGGYRPADLEALQALASPIAEAFHRRRAEEELRRTRELLEAELADTALLQGISAALIQPDHAGDIYERIMDAATAIMHSDYASMQMLHPERGDGGELRLLAFRGFNPQAARFWEWVRADSDSTCGVALRTARRVIAADVETCPFMAGTEDHATYRATGIRAVQTTPLLSRTGALVGMISTHWKAPHQPSERDLRLLDILARQAADLIECKRAEAEIHSLNAHLEERVRQRTAELEAANRELEGFTYAASHDMRAPLGRINSFSTILSQKYRERLDGDGLLALDLIRQNATRLNTLVEDLLGHAQLGRQNWDMGPVEVEATVQAILHERAEDIRRAGAEIRVDLPGGMTVYSNPVALPQILRNLVDNALKYSRHARPPLIEIGGRLEAGHCRLWVRDNGIGIAPVYQEKIFEIFRRLHTYSEYPGSGIGLALVKKAVERLNGTVSVESEPGRGATFFLNLPA
ncbi:MAG TPA: GAF domain-containing protein [Rhodocyclaceae bacterium]|nr:GAF domain-containing protein [Rhodocyclaceae bacterium]